MPQHNVVARRWDEQYAAQGGYGGRRPIEFVGRIIRTLREKKITGRGLYVGCGSGRNYVPLARCGLDLAGIDISGEAVRILCGTHPQYSDNISCTDIMSMDAEETFAYVIAIQSFQHGTSEETAGYFEKAAGLVRPGGLLFLRVNSASTQICFGHDVVERDPGGLTARYTEGPKRGLCIRFFSRRGLLDCLGTAGFDPLWGPREVTVQRRPPKTGTWSQWEAVARRLWHRQCVVSMLDS